MYIVDVNILILNVILNAVGQRNIDIRLTWTLLIVYLLTQRLKTSVNSKWWKYIYEYSFSLCLKVQYSLLEASCKFKNWLSQLKYQLITHYLLLAFTIFEITQIIFFLKIRCNWFSALMKGNVGMFDNSYFDNSFWLSSTHFWFSSTLINRTKR